MIFSDFLHQISLVVPVLAIPHSYFAGTQPIVKLTIAGFMMGPILISATVSYSSLRSSYVIG